MEKLWRNPVPSPAHLLRKCAGLYTGEFHKMFFHRHLGLGYKRDFLYSSFPSPYSLFKGKRPL
jgi:hypothetical protein